MRKIFIFSLMLLVAFAHLAVAVQDDAIVVFFDFESVSGDVVKDGSGNGNDGAINGGDAIVVDGYRGKGLKLDGADDHIAIPYADSMVLDNALTFAGWYYFTNLEPNNNLIDTRIPNSWANAGFNIWVKDAARNSVVSPNADGWAGAADTVNGVTAEVWTHIAMVVDDVQGKIQVYMNGVVESDAAVTPGGLVPSTQPMIIGARSDIQVDKCTYGIIDDITVWNVALTPLEIAQVLETGPTAVSPDGSLPTTWGDLKSR